MLLGTDVGSVGRYPTDTHGAVSSSAVTLINSVALSEKYFCWEKFVGREILYGVPMLDAARCCRCH